MNCFSENLLSLVVYLQISNGSIWRTETKILTTVDINLLAPELFF